ncbi:MAG: hypothetical protein ABSD80_09085 [Caulobacteraceae bacterium]|jgi:hypothetical protein
MNADAVDRPAGAVDAQDVWNIYNLVLRRDPELRTAIQARVGRPIKDVFEEFLKSSEFSSKVLSAIANKNSNLVPYTGTMSFGHLLVWARARLPVRSELRERLLHARSWAELDEMLFLDPELRRHLPQLETGGGGAATPPVPG